MSVRFYPSRLTAAAISPAYAGAWGDTTNAVRRKMTFTKPNEAVGDISVSTTVVNGTPKNVLMVQYVSDPLQAQTLSGAMEAALAVRESNTNLNAETHIVVRLVSNDGTTVRGTLYTSATPGAATGNEWTSGTYPTVKRFPAAGNATFTSLGALDGDRLVVEVGARVYPGASATYSLVLNQRTDATADFPKVNDYPAYEGATARNGMGFIEFTSDVLLQTDPLRSCGLDFSNTMTGSVAGISGPTWTVEGGWKSGVGALANGYAAAAYTTDTTADALADVTDALKTIEFLLELPTEFPDVPTASIYSFAYGNDLTYYPLSGPGGSMDRGMITLYGIDTGVLTSLAPGKKIHLVVTVDGSNLKYYVNNTLVKTAASPVTAFPTGIHYINGRANSAGVGGAIWRQKSVRHQLFVGYSTTASAAQVTALYDKHARTDVIPLAHHLFKFQDTGATQADSVWGGTITPGAGWAAGYIPQSGAFTSSIKANTGTPKAAVTPTANIKAFEILLRSPRTAQTIDILAWGAGENDKVWMETGWGYLVAAGATTGHGSGVGDVLHVIVSLEASGAISIYANGIRKARYLTGMPNPAQVALATAMYLNGYGNTGGNVNTLDVAYQALGLYSEAIDAEQAAALYAARVPANTTPPTAAFALNFAEAATPFNDLQGGTDWTASGSWSFHDAPFHPGFTYSARTNATTAYASQTTPANVRAYEMYVIPASGDATLVGWGATDADEIRIKNGSSLAASGALAQSTDIFPGRKTHVIVSFDGGDEVSVFVNGERVQADNVAAVIGSVGSGTTYVNGSPSNPTVARVTGLKWQYFAGYTTPIGDDAAAALYWTRLLGSETDFVAVGASLLPSGSVRVSLSSTLAQITLTRTDGLSDTPVTLIPTRMITGSYEFTDTTAPYGTWVTYSVNAVFQSDLSAGADTVTLTSIAFPDGSADGVCYPIVISDPVLSAGNVIATLQAIEDMSYPGRGDAFPVLGKRNPVALSSKRSGAVSSIRMITHTNAQAAAVRNLLNSGRVLMFRVPTEARPERAYWFGSVSSPSESRVISDIRRPERKFTLDFIEVDRPDTSALLPGENTWASIRANNASYTALSARAGSWENVINDPSIGGSPV